MPDRGSVLAVARVGLYYGLLVGAIVVLLEAVPGVRDSLTLGGAPPVGSGALGLEGGVPADGWSGVTPLAAVLAMLGALLLVVPVAWVYTVTKRGQRFDPSVVQTVILLPIAVAGIVMIVQYSLPLAFSLAGIVAAVRFRNTLKDTKDAVYIFLAIGVGVAAGIHAFAVAFIMSVAFNLVVLGLWAFHVGGLYADGATSGTAGGAAGPAAATDTKPFHGVLRVRAADLAAARPLVETVLASDAKRWRAAGALPADGGGGVLDYFVRFRKKTPAPHVIEALRRHGGAQRVSAEFHPFEE